MFILSLIFLILALVFCVISVSVKEEKSSKFTRWAALLCALSSFVIFLLTNIKPPIIMPLNNETTTYIEPIEITLENENKLFSAYYTLDGSNPKEGYKYENAITISESTTVAARNKFFWMWSDITSRGYRFEKLHFNNEEPSLSNNNDIVGRLENTSIPEPSTDVLELETESESEHIETEEKHPIPETETPSPTPVPINISEGLNNSEGYNLLNYANQYRTDAGIGELAWDSYLEQVAQNFASSYALGTDYTESGAFYLIGRQCNGAKNAQRAVSDWITGNDYIPSEAEKILSPQFTKMGGALYYLPNGNEFGYHYFWIICLE